VRLAEDASVRCFSTIRMRYLVLDLALSAVEEVNVFEIRYSKTFDEFAAEGAQDLNGCGWLQTRKNTDGDAGNPQKRAWLQGGHVRRAGAVIHERNFSHKVAGTQAGELDIFVWGLRRHHSTSANDEIKAMSGIATGNNFLTRQHVNSISELKESRQLLLIKTGKETELR